jgi:hypothetical protein
MRYRLTKPDTSYAPRAGARPFIMMSIAMPIGLPPRKRYARRQRCVLLIFLILIYHVRSEPIPSVLDFSRLALPLWRRDHLPLAILPCVLAVASDRVEPELRRLADCGSLVGCALELCVVLAPPAREYGAGHRWCSVAMSPVPLWMVPLDRQVDGGVRNKAALDDVVCGVSM